MNSVAHLFTGKAGEHAAASRFLIHNWSVAFPALDLGVDLLIADQNHGQARRVQVKTANAQEQKGSYVAQFNLPVLSFVPPSRPNSCTSSPSSVLTAGRTSSWSSARN